MAEEVITLASAERKREYKRLWYQKNRERLRLAWQARYRDDPAYRKVVAERNKKRIKNRAKDAARLRARRANDPDFAERSRAIHRRWRATSAGRESAKSYRQRTRERTRAYALENRERRRGLDRLRYKALRKDGSEYIKLLLRARLNRAIKCSLKRGSAVRDLGCTINEFKRHIERQFQRGMTWENWGHGSGKWHLDHIRPLTLFDLKDQSQFREAAHFTNYRPLWSADNLAKGASHTLLL